jgi:chromate transport protein ChrA
LNVFL